MPWKKAKALNAAGPPHQFIALFAECFRIQREASEAAGRHIPLIVENVRGAQRWVGRARWNFGSYYLWGDVPALMPHARAFKSAGMNWSDPTKRGQDFTRIAGSQAIKNAGYKTSSGSPARKFASAMIAKIPLPLSRHIARTFAQSGSGSHG